MSDELRPYPDGTSVVTTTMYEPDKSHWAEDVLQSKRWGIQGNIVSSYWAIGRTIYKVRHADGSESAYTSKEFSVIE